jgi:hypothetical protein
MPTPPLATQIAGEGKISEHDAVAAAEKSSCNPRLLLLLGVSLRDSTLSVQQALMASIPDVAEDNTGMANVGNGGPRGSRRSRGLRGEL